MAQHGYLGEGFGAHGDFDPDRDEDRERGRFRERDRNPERDLREDQDFWRDQRPQFMFGDEEQERPRGRGMSHYGREHGFGGFQGDYSGGREQGGFGGYGDYSHGRRSFSPHRDDHYLSWRDRQIQELDRDYEEFCREREQDFHRDFDSWRRNRQGSRQQVVAGEKDELVLGADQQAGPSAGMTTDAPNEPQATVDPDSAATLGQGGETRGGRGRR